ncbi:tRNA-specific adenosine deaminase [Candidatus Izimaplasma bacterium HR1]|uniref:tRNA adenosine(34) deaminase TadA n=1 Tax=Candidatus Izimoplasma sp. HR1 TaxID=1541959 RepID=UPI0004F6A38F|nr:tRNA-specific adenosine deaminase [Candidatus Izimaplasma bacterium HR1]
MPNSHEYYMNLALEQAAEASLNNEVPIGAIIIKDDKVIAVARNERVETNKTTSHAEIIAIEKANKLLKSWRLDSCSIYVTIEPCPMCAGAIIQSRISNVIYGAKDPKAGSHTSIVQLFDKSFNHRVEVTSGILENECSEIISSFFQKIRKSKK